MKYLLLLFVLMVGCADEILVNNYTALSNIGVTIDNSEKYAYVATVWALGDDNKTLWSSSWVSADSLVVSAPSQGFHITLIAYEDGHPKYKSQNVFEGDLKVFGGGEFVDGELKIKGAHFYKLAPWEEY